MKISIRNLVLAALLTSGAMAAESGLFVGIDTGFMSVKNEIGNKGVSTLGGPNQNVLPSNTVSFSDSTFEGILKVGYHFDSTHRVYLAYVANNVEGKKVFTQGSAGSIDTITVKFKETSKFLLGYDYTPELVSMWRGVAGIYAGFLRRDVSLRMVDTPNPHLPTDVAVKSSGNLLGLKLGAIYEVAKNSDIEFGMKFESASMGNKSDKDKDDIMVVTFSNQKQSNIGLYAGYVYKF
ncbi:MAG: hypothetical protein ACTTH5_02700 [Wolinella sp.]